MPSLKEKLRGQQSEEPKKNEAKETEEAELHEGSIPELRHDVREILIAAGIRKKSIDDLVETLISRFVTGKR